MKYRPWIGIPVWIIWCVFAAWKGITAITDVLTLFIIMHWASKGGD